MSNKDKMIGKKHDRQCDCGIEHIVSSAGEKCNRRYGNKRSRAKEKRDFQRELRKE